MWGLPVEISWRFAQTAHVPRRGSMRYAHTPTTHTQSTGTCAMLPPTARHQDERRGRRGRLAHPRARRSHARYSTHREVKLTHAGGPFVEHVGALELMVSMPPLKLKSSWTPLEPSVISRSAPYSTSSGRRYTLFCMGLPLLHWSRSRTPHASNTSRQLRSVAIAAGERATLSHLTDATCYDTIPVFETQPQCLPAQVTMR